MIEIGKRVRVVHDSVDGDEGPLIGLTGVVQDVISNDRRPDEVEIQYDDGGGLEWFTRDELEELASEGER